MATVRARWIQRLGEHPARGGFTRVPLAELALDADALLPLHDGVSPGAAHALVRSVAIGGDGAYRQARSRMAVARVD